MDKVLSQITSGTTWMLRYGSAKMVMDSAEIVLTRTTLVEEENESWRWGRTRFLGDNQDKDFYNDGC